MKRISRGESPSNTSMCWFLDEDGWNRKRFQQTTFFIFRGVQKKILVSKNKHRLLETFFKIRGDSQFNPASKNPLTARKNPPLIHSIYY